MLARLSFRYKLPLALTATAVLTAVVIGAVMLAYGYLNTRDALVRHAHDLADALVATARPALRNNDVWAAFTTLRGGTASPGEPGGPSELRVLLSAEGRVMAANEPRRFPVGGALDATEEGLPTLQAWIDRRGIPQSPVLLDRTVVPDQIVLVAPVLSQATPIGALVLAYPKQRLTAGFRELVTQGSLAILGVLAVLLPVGWYLGHRIASPLSRLAGRLSTLGRESPEEVAFEEPGALDEIGRLHRAYNAMLEDLREKAALERQVIVSERLAAVGRLTSSVAHEVNNPLGGLLIAVDTLKRTEPDNMRVQRSAALLERGLEQIRRTVSALLVQARPEDRMLRPEDLEDIRTLLSTRLEREQGQLDWQVDLHGTVPLPATTIRQIVINLGLNAIDALDGSDGRIACRVSVDEEWMEIVVDNDGPPIPGEFIERLFEPFTGLRPEGTGMGLWITYQLVDQLGGTIEVDSGPETTRFRVIVPLPTQSETRNELTGT